MEDPHRATRPSRWLGDGRRYLRARMDSRSTCATAIAFDFAAKRLADIDAAGAKAEMAAGRFVWIDVNLERADEARALLESLGLCHPEILEDAFTRDPATQIGRYEDCLHLWSSPDAASPAGICSLSAWTR